MGTVPSLTSPSLPTPLTESTDILRYIDNFHNNSTLVPKDPETKRKAQAIMDLVHSEQLGTNLIFFQARDNNELNAKKNTPLHEFLATRQGRLEQEATKNPDHPYYGPKGAENGSVYKFYESEFGAGHADFYALTHNMYRQFAAGLDKLDKLLQLPYAAGDHVTEADFHVVPWLSHGMVAAGSVPTDIQDFTAFESVIQKTVPGFKVGPNMREWWANVSKTDSFKAVFPKLH